MWVLHDEMAVETKAQSLVKNILKIKIAIFKSIKAIRGGGGGGGPSLKFHFWYVIQLVKTKPNLYGFQKYDLFFELRGNEISIFFIFQCNTKNIISQKWENQVF